MIDYALFLKRTQRRIAQISVGASALRNQGAPGIVDCCRMYFEESINLEKFKAALDSGGFKLYLDRHTQDLLDRFPPAAGGKSWGAARKGLNLFFRDVVYNAYLARHLKIPMTPAENNELIQDLEVPLDRDVATGLKGKFSDLPRWKSIKSLTPELSDIYQEKAAEYGAQQGLARVHVDLEFWRE